ncbi:MAG: metallophosphoesterase [Myxococcales bacterium]|nr:metallophosphoesterase [Myxococcales bacterium]
MRLTLSFALNLSRLASVALALTLPAACTQAASRSAGSGDDTRAVSAAGPSGAPKDDGALDVAEGVAAPVSDVTSASDDGGVDVPSASEADEAAIPTSPPPARITSEGRVVAIGDVHGDLDATRRALRLGGLVDDDDHWAGGHTVAVQVGDQLDRGDGERAILDWFEVLTQEAHDAGGAFIPLIGNHEQMNAQLDFRYVTDGGWVDFADVPGPGLVDPRVTALPTEQRGRAAAFLPGGPYALLLAKHNVVQIVDATLFVHGGITPLHAALGLDALNVEHRAWLEGAGTLSALWEESDSPVWDRTYSADTSVEACALLEETFDLLGIERLVVAHTVQDSGINTACDGRVYRIDVGLAAHYGGPMQVLEILGGVPTILE